ncbi:MAG: SRPBCC family protein [Bacteroidota bacterium]
MKILKYIGIIVAVIILLYVGLCFLGPKNFNMTETKNISAPPLTIYNILNDLRTTSQWNDWNLQDTAMEVTYTAVTTGVGARTEWISKKMGNGSQEIVESVRPNRVKTALDFDGWDGTDHAVFEITPDGQQSKLSWTFEAGSNVPFLMRGGFLLGRMKAGMRSSFKTGLKNIKKLAEERANDDLYNGYQVQLIELPERNYIMNRQEVDVTKRLQFYSTQIGSLFSKLQQSKIDMVGKPGVLYFRWDENKGVADMAVAVPVEDAISIANTQSYTIPAQQAIQVDYQGPYELIGPAHEAVDAYMLDHGYLQDVPTVEEYITDASEEKNPDKWLTRITYFFTEKG